MFSKILIPLDGRDEAAIALTPARAVAEATGASLTLLTVVDDGALGVERAAAETALAYRASSLAADGVSVETRLRVGTPATEIVAAATEAGADLIAMATHGRSGLVRAFLGSVAQQVVASSPVPVLLLHPEGHAMTQVSTMLVPVDGSPGGALALASAVALSGPTKARIVLVQVVVPLMAYRMVDASGFGAGYGGGLYVDPDWDADALHAAERYTGALADRLRSAGAAAEGLAVMGGAIGPSASVVEAIGAAADRVDADLIVMSTHAHTGAARLLLGSVADALVRNSHRPVLLVRRGGAEDAPLQDTADVPEECRRAKRWRRQPPSEGRRRRSSQTE
jgi:nucleotide-binding universal stress UspA family protein